MKEKMLFMTCLAVIFLLPNLSSAECTSIGYFTSFVIHPPNTVVLYVATKPVLRFDVQDCAVTPSSKILPIKSDVCDSDPIMIDGVKCIMMEIKPQTGYYSP